MRDSTPRQPGAMVSQIWPLLTEALRSIHPPQRMTDTIYLPAQVTALRGPEHE
jgi:hypothetical protein